jgi:ribosomal protein S27AE
MDGFVVLGGTFHSLVQGDLVKAVFHNGVANYYQFVSDSRGSVFEPLLEKDHRIGTRTFVREFRVDSEGIYRLRKAFCNKCGFLVVYEDHVDRCQNSRDRTKDAVRMKRRAWVGDALLLLDVRTALLADVVDTKHLTIMCSQHICDSNLAALYVAYAKAGVQYSYPALGESTRQLAQAFEANYSTVRKLFLKEFFPFMVDTDVQDCMIKSLRDGSRNDFLDLEVVEEDRDLPAGSGGRGI